MREVKFRAYHHKRKQMSQPFTLFERDGYDITWVAKADEPEPWKVPEFTQEACTFMQYTGLKDKNGAEIYEGDILNNDAVVEWFDNLNWDSGGSNHPGFYCRAWFEYKDEGGMSYHYGFDENIEVIGNIWENGDLLK